MYKIIYMAWDLYSSSIARRCLNFPRLASTFPWLSLAFNDFPLTFL